MLNINNLSNLAEGLSTLAKHTQLSFRFRVSGWPAAASIFGLCICTAGTVLGGLAINAHHSNKKDLDPPKNDPDLFLCF